MFDSTNGQIFSGKKPKEPLEYFIDYYSLNDECLKTISFGSYCIVVIACLFLTHWKGYGKEKIAQMVNAVCKKVGTRYFPPGSKIDEEGMDVHP